MSRQKAGKFSQGTQPSPELADNADPFLPPPAEEEVQDLSLDTSKQEEEIITQIDAAIQGKDINRAIEELKRLQSRVNNQNQHLVNQIERILQGLAPD